MYLVRGCRLHAVHAFQSFLLASCGPFQCANACTCVFDGVFDFVGQVSGWVAVNVLHVCARHEGVEAGLASFLVVFLYFCRLVVSVAAEDVWVGLFFDSVDLVVKLPELIQKYELDHVDAVPLQELGGFGVLDVTRQRKRHFGGKCHISSLFGPN